MVAKWIVFEIITFVAVFAVSTLIYKYIRKVSWMDAAKYGAVFSIVYCVGYYLLSHYFLGETSKHSNSCENGIVVFDQSGNYQGCVEVNVKPPLREFYLSLRKNPQAWIPNPAVNYCKALGYEVETITTENGSVSYCIFPDGSKCPAWSFLAGECGKEWTFCKRYLNGMIVGSKPCSVSTKCAICKVKLDKERECLDWFLAAGYCRIR